MTLLELLVQELPKKGGWKFGINAVYQDWDGELRIDSEHHSSTKIFLPLSEIFRQRANMKISLPDDAFVTRQQYEAALAASKQVKWLPGALPPEGIECEVKSGRDSWTLCKIAHSSSAGVAFIYLEEPDGSSSYLGVLDCISAKAAGNQFRPISTEAGRKREDVIKQMAHSLRANGDVTNEQLDRLYDDISNGTIFGVKLED